MNKHEIPELTNEELERIEAMAEEYYLSMADGGNQATASVRCIFKNRG